jgi:hypothetical protein
MVFSNSIGFFVDSFYKTNPTWTFSVFGEKKKKLCVVFWFWSSSYRETSEGATKQIEGKGNTHVGHWLFCFFGFFC